MFILADAMRRPRTTGGNTRKQQIVFYSSNAELGLGPGCNEVFASIFSAAVKRNEGLMKKDLV